MTSEYVRMSKEEVLYSQKVFLQSQLEMLSIFRFYKNFLKLRNDEFMLKIALKNKVDLVMTEIAMLEKMLPKSNIKANKSQFSDLNLKINLSLEDEINLIKSKLERLH